MTKSVVLNQLEWSVTWDTEERNLAEDAGEGSDAKVSAADNELRIDGSLGYFRASAEFGKPLVAFVRINAPWAPSARSQSSIGQICVRASGHPADLTVRFALETAYTESKFQQTRKKGSYQTEFKLTAEFREFCFADSDFHFVIRGLRQTAPPIRFADVQKLGFLVTRSSQVSGVSTEQAALPFRVTIKDISTRNN